jgi:hypothetical protein
MGFILSPLESQPNRTTFQWVLDMDLQIPRWIPRGMIDKAFIAASLDTIKALRNKLARTVDSIEIDNTSTEIATVAGSA